MHITLDIKFVKSQDTATLWNGGITEYKLYDASSNLALGTILLDPFYIPNGSNGALDMKIQSKKLLDNGNEEMPVVVLNPGFYTTFTTETFYLHASEYITLAYELGHVLNNMLDDNGMTGDLIEVPAKILEIIAQQPLFFKALLSENPDVLLSKLPDGFEEYWNYYEGSSRHKIEMSRGTLAYSATILKIT